MLDIRSWSTNKTYILYTEAYLVLAHGIISDYLPEDLSSTLHKHLKLPEAKSKKIPLVSGSENKPPPKKPSVEGPVDDYSKDNIPVSKVRKYCSSAFVYS